MTHHEVQPFFLPDRQDWTRELLVRQHSEVLYRYGEYAMFILMWTPKDFADGLVRRCPVCYTSSNRFADAYKQPTRSDCPACFGTSFEGGYRARIVRPSLWGDRDPEVGQTERGYVQTETLALESTDDFTWRTGDYAIRSSGERYRTASTGNTTSLRTGHGQPYDELDTVALNAGSVRLEDPSSVAYRIPPDGVTAVAALTVPVGRNSPVDFSAIEVIRAPLLL